MARVKMRITEGLGSIQPFLFVSFPKLIYPLLWRNWTCYNEVNVGIGYLFVEALSRLVCDEFGFGLLWISLLQEC